MKDYYKVLGISKLASTKEINDAFKNLTKNLDKHDEQYRSYLEAFKILVNYHQRRAYDEQLEYNTLSLYPRSDFDFSSFDHINNYFNTMQQRFNNHMKQFDNMFNESLDENNHVYKQEYESRTIQENGEMIKAEKYKLNKDGNENKKYRVTKRDKNGNVVTKDIDPKTLKNNKDLLSLEYFGKK